MFDAALFHFALAVIEAAFTLKLGQFAFFYPTAGGASIELVRVIHLPGCRFNFNKV